MKKRFFILLACGTALGLLISSGLSCISCIIYPEGPITYWLPATDSEFKSWIMPECQEIKETLQDILGDPPTHSLKLALIIFETGLLIT